jgi:biopolymer transport protein ExbB
LHDLMFYALYGLAAVGAYVITERLIFYTVTLRDAKRLSQLSPGELRHLPAGVDPRGVAGEAVQALSHQRPALNLRHDHEDAAEVAYIAAKARLSRHLWIVDTLVTAAPLLGLLGTILGIIDTFQALASSGVSDPAAVSRGIGTALFATALGIAIALGGLLANNFFQDKVERIGDCLKLAILKAGLGHGEVISLVAAKEARAANDR